MGIHSSRTKKRHANDGSESLADKQKMISVPDDVVIVILSFLPIKDLQNCSRVSSSFRSLVNSSSLWKMKCIREGKYRERVMGPLYPSDWRTFYLKQPFSRNLVKNPSGKDKFSHWKKLENGGDGWIVEDKDIGSGKKPPELLAMAGGKPCSFATSYGWCSKCQVIDLIKEGFEEDMLDKLQPPFKVGEWYATRFDCSNFYEINVTLQKTKTAEEQDVIDSFNIAEKPVRGSPNNWKEISHVFKNYGPGLRFITFTHRSKDSQFWAGHYGAKMAGSYIMVSYT